jgi:exodeoxyribonuclease VII small subunit
MMPELQTRQSDPTSEDLSFEQAFARLEEIVASMESGEHSLESALEKFEEGKLLARRCAQLLERAELKVKQLSGEDLIDLNVEN